MNEVEKMYSNANIKICKRKQGFTLKDCTDRDCKECGYCDMPSFTAEKQIALYQLLTQQCDLTTSHFMEWKFIHYDGQKLLQITGKDFTETFAKLINVYWQFLTEERRKQIKEILE